MPLAVMVCLQLLQVHRMYSSGRPAGLNRRGLILVELNLAIFPHTAKSLQIKPQSFFPTNGMS